MDCKCPPPWERKSTSYREKAREGLFYFSNSSDFSPILVIISFRMSGFPKLNSPRIFKSCTDYMIIIIYQPLSHHGLTFHSGFRTQVVLMKGCKHISSDRWMDLIFKPITTCTCMSTFTYMGPLPWNLRQQHRLHDSQFCPFRALFTPQISNSPRFKLSWW